MDIKTYFETAKGTGVLSTSDSEGNVDSAIYARPHIMEDGSISFIMRDKLSHKNLETNPKASYIFIEEGKGYKGKRLVLKKIKEEKDSDLIDKLARRHYADDRLRGEEKRFLVSFLIEKERPLVA
eukprot:gnl/Chilomastix_cuspidata/9944.p1 GENE.gnl/Chilomastix_cuspidata/9944~~gnl/Chilomastix_cuspidata/9944.p1  ORF type:complete len:141 (-),score=0.98 gnl/Chilomastix_cuspidata/9944:109-483(-)